MSPPYHPFASLPRILPPARLLPVILLLIVLLFHCPSGKALAVDAPLPVIVSIPPQKHILERIAGERVTVAVPVRPGADPHSFEPSPAQMRTCAAARVWFTIGVPFEDIWLPRIQSSAPKLAIVSTIAHIKRLPFTDDALSPAHQESHGAEDPHVWLSPMLVRGMLPGMTKELSALFPDHAGEFRANADIFAAELQNLDEHLAERFSGFSRDKRVFLTFHPSWRYFALNYELTELAIEVDGKEPGPQSMKAVINAARTYGIHTIFVEPQFPKAAAQAVAANINAKVVELDPLAENLLTTFNALADKLIESFSR
jgi:zinc transport system substrate-binding protein